MLKIGKIDIISDSEPPIEVIQKLILLSGFNTTSHKCRVRTALNFIGEHSSFISRGRKFHSMCALYKNPFFRMGDIF